MAAVLLALAVVAGSGGCAIQAMAREYPVGRIQYMDLKEYQERLDAREVKSVANVYITERSKTESIAEKSEQWEYVDRREGKREGYEMYKLIVARALGGELKAVHGSIYRYWEGGKEKIKVFLAIESSFGAAELKGGFVHVYVDKKNQLITLYTKRGGGRTLFGYVSRWKKSKGLF